MGCTGPECSSSVVSFPIFFSRMHPSYIWKMGNAEGFLYLQCYTMDWIHFSDMGEKMLKNTLVQVKIAPPKF